jgi:hypothetical protein
LPAAQPVRAIPRTRAAVAGAATVRKEVRFTSYLLKKSSWTDRDLGRSKN